MLPRVYTRARLRSLETGSPAEPSLSAHSDSARPPANPRCRGAAWDYLHQATLISWISMARTSIKFARIRLRGRGDASIANQRDPKCAQKCVISALTRLNGANEQPTRRSWFGSEGLEHALQPRNNEVLNLEMGLFLGLSLRWYRQVQPPGGTKPFVKLSEEAQPTCQRRDPCVTVPIDAMQRLFFVQSWRAGSSHASTSRRMCRARTDGCRD
jgi:hypothetical protein